MTTKTPIKKHRRKSESRTPAQRPGIRRNREQTEQLLLDACERLLVRDGPDGIGVNNVVEEAGVGKELIYRYFGGLPGLVKAWLSRSANWPTALELVGGNLASFSQLSLKEQFRCVQHNYVQALRSRPVITRIMASELMAATEVTVILEDASDKIARELTKIFKDLDQGNQEDIVALSFVFYCMANYLCMRAVTSPHCFGMDLTSDKSWQRIEATIDQVIDRFLP